MAEQVPTVRLVVNAFRVSIPVQASQLPLRGFPLDGAAPDVLLKLPLDNGEQVQAYIRGKTFRRAAKLIQPRLAAGEDPTVLLQGNLRANGELTEVGITA